MRRLVCALLLLALAGCGGARSARKADIASYGSKTAVSVSPAPSASVSAAAANAKEAWVAAADAVCADLNNEMVALQAAPPTTEAALAKYLDQIAGVMRRLEGRLRAIPGTYGATGTAKALVDSVAQTVAAFTQAIAAIKAGNLAGAQSALAKGFEVSSRVDELAKRLEMTSCVLPGG